MPGSPLDPRARGSNRLIRDGATLTEAAEDVLTVLRPIFAHTFEETVARPTAATPAADTDRTETTRARVEEKLGPAPVEIDEQIRQCGCPPPTF